MMLRNESVIVVFDKHGKYFQTWESHYNGDGIKHGISVAKQISGSYFIIQTNKSILPK